MLGFTCVQPNLRVLNRSAYMNEIPKGWLRLTGKWQDIAAKLPETGMGYTVTAVVLKDGTRFDDVIVMPPYIVGIRGLARITFSDQDIEQITVTHHKWDWSNESWNLVPPSY